MLALSILMLDNIGVFDLGNYQNFRTSLFNLENTPTEQSPTLHPTPKSLPTAQIIEILPNSITKGDTMLLHGSGTTPSSKQQLTSTNHPTNQIVDYEWKSNLNGPLGTTSLLSINNLKTGTHTISFRVKDNQNRWSNYAQKTLVVTAPPPNPQPEILNWNVPETCQFDSACPIAFDILNNSDSPAEHAYIYLELPAEVTPKTISQTAENSYYAIDSVLTDKNGNPVNLTTPVIRWETTFKPHENQAFWVNLFPTEELQTDQNLSLKYQVWVTMKRKRDDETTFTLPINDLPNLFGYPSITKTLKIIGPENHTPQAEIISITPNPAKTNGPVRFSGHGHDLLDNHRIIQYRWTSSLDGLLSNKSQFETRNLSPGTHIITLDVKDEFGLWSSKDPDQPQNATLTLTVQPAYIGPV